MGAATHPGIKDNVFGASHAHIYVYIVHNYGHDLLIYSVLFAGNMKEFNLTNILNALNEANFAAAHWKSLGLQLNRPPSQLTNIKYKTLIMCPCCIIYTCM